MKPVPHQKHLAAALILAAVASVQTVLACLDNRLSVSQVQLVTARVKHHAPDSFPGDPTYGASSLWRRDNPFQRVLADAALTDESGCQPYVAFGLAAGVLAAVYLFGMYALLVHQCRIWSVSVLVALFSMRVVDTLGNAYWGVGSLSSATPEGLFIAAAPWLVLACLRTADRGPMVLVFAVTGLVGNAYVPGAVAVAVAMGAAYLASDRLTLRRLRLAAACAGCVLITLAPAWVHQAYVAGSVASGAGRMSAEGVTDALSVGNLHVGYGAMLKSLLNWSLMTAVLLLPAGILLLRATRHRVRNGRFWLCLAAAPLILALPLHCASLLIGTLRSGPPPTIDLIRASALVMLPVYVFFAEGLVALFRMLHTYRRLIRTACALLMVVWFVGSENLRIARHQFMDTAAMFLDDESKPRSVHRHRKQIATGRELAAIALWARRPDGAGAPAVFLVDPAASATFRMISRRAVAASRDDVLNVYTLSPQSLVRWHERVGAQMRLLAGKADAKAVRQFVTTWQEAGLFKNVATWYLIIPADRPAPEGLTDVPGQGWGEVYHLYRYAPA